MQEKGLQGPPSTAHHPKTVAVAEAVAAVEAEVAVSRTAAIRTVVPTTAPHYRNSVIRQEFIYTI